jgi:hypothetical protein
LILVPGIRVNFRCLRAVLDEGESEMVSKGVRSTFIIAILIGGPLVGWILNDDRGIIFGMAASVLALFWFRIEHRTIV